MKKFALLFMLILFGVYLSGCGDSLPIEEDLSSKSYTLLNQDSVKVEFPELVKGKIVVIGYIYTNCPDICPLTTNNMRIVHDKVQEEGIDGVEFVTVSFDPAFDTPSVLKEYAEVRGLDTSNWEFLTGSKEEIDRLMKDVGIVFVPSDSTKLENGETMYFYAHTDRMALIDQQGRVRKNYKGSANSIEIKCKNCGQWIEENVLINQDYIDCSNCGTRNEFESQLTRMIKDIKTLAN